MYNSHHPFQYKSMPSGFHFVYFMPCPLCIYRYPGIIYKPDEKSAHDNAQTGKGYRKAKKIGSKYNSGLGETLEYIGCYNPLVLDFLLKCNIPYKDARKIVKKMINSII